MANAILMEFDLSALPSGATLVEAQLKLTLVEVDSTADASYTLTLHKIVDVDPDLDLATGFTYDGVNPWSPSDCCYDGIPLAQSDISGAHDTLVVGKTLGATYFDATLMVGQWLATLSSNRGLLINSDPSQLIDRYRYFASMEHADVGAQPLLEVTYVP